MGTNVEENQSGAGWEVSVECRFTMECRGHECSGGHLDLLPHGRLGAGAGPGSGESEEADQAAPLQRGHGGGGRARDRRRLRHGPRPPVLGVGRRVGGGARGGAELGAAAARGADLLPASSATQTQTAVSETFPMSL